MERPCRLLISILQAISSDAAERNGLMVVEAGGPIPGQVQVLVLQVVTVGGLRLGLNRVIHQQVGKRAGAIEARVVLHGRIVGQNPRRLLPSRGLLLLHL